MSHYRQINTREGEVVVPGFDVEEIVAAARQRLGLGADRPWRLITARRKLGKLLFEVAEDGPDGLVRMIGKVSREERTRVTYQSLVTLWNAGFRPPSEFTVVQPILHLPEHNLVVQERAPGVELMEKIQHSSPDAEDLTAKSALWLTRLHSSDVKCAVWPNDWGRLASWSAELESAAPAERERLRAVTVAALAKVAVSHPGAHVPCHGDYHPLNIFIAGNGRMTVIDVDKFGGRERVEEVGYTLAQTASICFHRLGSFGSSLRLRRRFLECYEGESGVALDRSALGAYMAATLLKNLHYDLITYRSGRLHKVPEWLDAASQCLEGRIELG